MGHYSVLLKTTATYTTGSICEAYGVSTSLKYLIWLFSLSSKDRGTVAPKSLNTAPDFTMMKSLRTSEILPFCGQDPASLLCQQVEL
jgi:hypothetical protein